MGSRGFIDEVMTHLVNQQQLSAAWYEAGSIQKRWGVIREYYMRSMADIEKSGAGGWGIDVYEIPILSGFSPIEQLAWDELRSRGMVMYPQFPVFNWFIDFANPHLRIGLELDGAAYHDPIKDAEKDEFLMGQDWKIFRITGAEMNRHMRESDEPDDGFDWWTWFETTGDGVIAALDRMYFHPTSDEDPLKDYARYALSKHTTAKV